MVPVQQDARAFDDPFLFPRFNVRRTGQVEDDAVELPTQGLEVSLEPDER